MSGVVYTRAFREGRVRRTPRQALTIVRALRAARARAAPQVATIDGGAVRDLLAESGAEARLVEVPADRPPWTPSGFHVDAGDEVTWLACRGRDPAAGHQRHAAQRPARLDRERCPARRRARHADVHRRSQRDPEARQPLPRRTAAGRQRRRRSTPLRSSWRLDALPSRLPEGTRLTHDYLSVALEFDDGQVLSWHWSCALPAGFAYRCPLDHWRHRESHIVARIGTADLGRWVEEERPVLADHRVAIGGQPSTRVVPAWLISGRAVPGR